MTSGFVTQWGFTEEATFGTAIAASAAFTTFEGAPPSVYYGVFQDKSIKHRGYNAPDIGDHFITQSGGTRVIGFSDVNVRRSDIADFLYLILQNVTEAAGSPYQKDYTVSSTYAAPDFSANAGMFVTLGIKDTIASYHRLFTSCILRSLTLKASLSGDGRMKASGEFISGIVAATTTNFNTGAWAFRTQNYYDFTAPTTKTIAGTAINFIDWEITIENGAIRQGNDSNGYNTSFHIGDFNITGSFTALYDANTDNYLADFLAGTPRALILADGAGTGQHGYFSLSLPNIHFDGNEMDYANPAGRVIKVPFTAKINAATNALITCEVSDGVDRAW